MSGLELVLGLLAVSVALRVFAERWRVPFATLLVVGGSIIALIPNLPRVTIDPDTLFLIFVPPLLYWGALTFPLRDLRQEAGPILRLSVLMVVISAAAVAIVIHRIDPAFTWAAAFALGAIVSPPDPVAVLAILKWVPVRREVERILEGEGLLNDATALVLYRFAVVAALTGIFSLSAALTRFVLVAVGGVVVGLVVAELVMRVRRLVREVDVVDSTISLLTPFAAYLSAEGIGASGVIAVVVAAMRIGRKLEDIPSPASRVIGVDMWTVVTFLLESLVFILVGIELPSIVRNVNASTLVWQSVAVCVSLIVVRLVWMFPSAYFGRMVDRALRRDHQPLPPWRTVLFVGWAGVRGADSIIIALALPVVFPARDQIIFIAFCVVFASLVFVAPTLRPLVRALQLPSDDRAKQEEVHARRTSVEAGLAALAQAGDGTSHPDVVRDLREHRRKGTQHAAEYRRIRSIMIAAERRSVRALRDEGAIGDEIMWRLQRELDLEQMLLDDQLPAVEDSDGL